MKNKYTKLLLLVLLTFYFTNFQTVFAQVPQAINFQAIARDASGNPMVNTNIQIQLSVLDGSQTGTVVYQELRALQTNAYGSFSFQIGRDANFVPVGTFENIDWTLNSKFLKIDYDPSNTFTFNLTLGTIEFVTVPYAFAAESVVFIDASGAVDGDVLVYNATSGKFEPGQAGSSNVEWSDVQNKPNFATVATSGNYADLSNKPNISDVAALDNNLNTQLKNVSNPTDAQDAATKAYVDGFINIMVNNGLLVVDFSAANTHVLLGSSLSFMDLSAINATTWNWDFGDSNTSAVQNPTHTYADEGTYTVSLTAANDVISITKTKDDYITVTNLPLGSFIDSRDANVYQTITIGNQVWMAENLKYLPSVVGSATGSQTIPYYYVYGCNDTSVTIAKATPNYGTYGVLYNWSAAMAGSASSVANPSGVQGVCPAGWHLPSDAEWTSMENFLIANGYNYDGTTTGNKIAKSLASATLWDSSSNDGSVGNSDYPTYVNMSGFTALPGGGRSSNGTFNDVGCHGVWWSATENESNNAWVRLLYYNYSYVLRNYYLKEAGFSVRCVRD